MNRNKMLTWVLIVGLLITLLVLIGGCYPTADTCRRRLPEDLTTQ